MENMEILDKSSVLNTREAADYVGVSMSCVRNWAWRKLIPHYKSVSGRVYYSKDDLDKFRLAKRCPSRDEEKSVAEVRSLLKR